MLFTSCNKDEQPNKEVNDNPSEFQVFEENITVDSAELSWDESTSDHESEITYSIYLDDQILKSNIIETKFELLNLNSSTNYEIKIITKNEVGEASVSIQFTTLNNITLLLKKYLGNDGSEANLTYVNEKIDLISFNAPNYDSWTEYIYDANGNILEQNHGADLIYGNRAKYEYINNNFSEINLDDGYADAMEIHNIVYTKNSQYTRTEYFGDIEINYIGTFEVNLSKNADGKVIEVISVNTDTNSQSRLTFEYDKNQNLIKITDQNQNYYEIVYDNKFNFHTYPSGYSNGWIDYISDVASLLLLNDNLVKN